MSQLYELTKELIDLIKQVKPEIEIKSASTYGQVVDYQDLNIPVLDADALLTLIPQLFEGVENPEYMPITISNTYKVLNVTEIPNVVTVVDFKPEIKKMFLPKKLSAVLLTRYFVDGLWIESQESVIQDIIDNIKRYVK